MVVNVFLEFPHLKLDSHLMNNNDWLPVSSPQLSLDNNDVNVHSLPYIYIYTSHDMPSRDVVNVAQVQRKPSCTRCLTKITGKFFYFSPKINEIPTPLVLSPEKNI